MFLRTLSPFRTSSFTNPFHNSKFLHQSTLRNFISAIIIRNPYNNLQTYRRSINNRLTTTFCFSFCSSFNLQAPEQKNISNQEQGNPSPFQSLQELIAKIIETTAIRDQRLHHTIDQRVKNQLSKNIKSQIRESASEDELINLKSQQRIEINSSLIQNYEFMNEIQLIEDQRAIIMIRHSILWNQQYERLSIDELAELIEKLECSKQLKSNDIKSMAVIFLAVETLKKCILLPRIHKNMVCSTKSIFENLYSVKRGLEGEMKARENQQKLSNLLSFIQNKIENNINRMCYMKVQSQLQYLIGEIFRSFHEPNLYNDKTLCLMANPPRVIFDEPFHQEYDRFIEMTVLILFDKKIKKKSKIIKLESIKQIFQELQLYEEGKLNNALEKQNSCSREIRKLKSKVTQMGKRVGIIEWMQHYVDQNFYQ